MKQQEKKMRQEIDSFRRGKEEALKKVEALEKSKKQFGAAKTQNSAPKSRNQTQSIGPVLQNKENTDGANK
eukprot:CAMPEP_0170551680 /NCGR_PEP_ID=MMETSP0211-20121228/9683_1 /TAXON_ID=311385 /ORGANISM="Pseudokeronopsis sp., Strain OXSARD2" /LENGTH=70 /DNA_ID=CAMNT_0010859005 /DNA_START=626 /DNA_END=838 /DNA_ORIENTATION=-